MSTTVGRVAQLWVFPVKSMAGASVAQAEVVAGGLDGDRAWAVVDEFGATVTAAQQPRLRQVVPRRLDGELRLDVPGERPALPPDAAAEALSRWLGRTVRLAHRQGTGFVDVAPVHVVSRTSMRDAARHAEQCDACDISQPRANLVLELDAALPRGTERDWLGGTVAVGGARLEIVRHPTHCLGSYAEVVAPGPVAVGDRVVLG